MNTRDVHDVIANHNYFASSRDKITRISRISLPLAGLIKCIFMHSARTRCSGSMHVGRCFMSDIFIGLSARIPVLSVTQHIGVFVIPVGKSFTASRLPEAGIWKSIAKLIAQLQLPPPFPRDYDHMYLTWRGTRKRDHYSCMRIRIWIRWIELTRVVPQLCRYRSSLNREDPDWSLIHDRFLYSRYSI